MREDGTYFDQIHFTTWTATPLHNIAESPNIKHIQYSPAPNFRGTSSIHQYAVDIKLSIHHHHLKVVC